MLFSSKTLKDNKNIWFLPLSAIILLSLSHVLFQSYAAELPWLFSVTPKVYLIEKSIYQVLMALCEYWICVRIITHTFKYIKKNLIVNENSILTIVIPFFSSLLKAITFLILLNILIQTLQLPKDLAYTLNKLSSVLLICAISWLIFKLIDVAEQLLLRHFTVELSGSNVQRKVYTQTLILKRVAYSIVSVLTAGAILVLFDNVRALGASVLTTAGVVGLVLTFTAQRSLASIFSGLEIALTQPIKIGDSVVIDKEFGTIEEINFRNVIVKLWDWRRLIVPTSFFLDKTFENWSRVQNTNLIGTVYLYVDFTLPVADVRNHLESMIQQCSYWDKNVCRLQVGDLQERVMQLKILASARNPDDLNNLRAVLREELMSYIVKKHPSALPKTRSYAARIESDTKLSQADKMPKTEYS